jgi:hypothetical protein
MRRLLRRIGARTGISLALIILIGATVLVARLVDDGRNTNPYPRSPGVGPSVVDTQGNDSADDEQPTAYPDDAAILDVAAAFAAAWARIDLTPDEWLDGLRPHATDALIQRLANVDPSEVPANTSLGTPTLVARSDSHADVRVTIAPHDALALGLVKGEDGWRVATLDRETG